MKGLANLLGKANLVEVGAYLRENYVENPAEQARRAFAAKRHAMFTGKVEAYVTSLVNRAFRNERNRELRRDLIEWSKWNNLTARIIGEKATVYDENATRHIANDDETYQDFLEEVQQDDAMRELNQMLVLHEDVWVQYRVRELAGNDECVIDIIPPHLFWAVAHPNDRTSLVAIILDQTPIWQGVSASDPHYRVWCAGETFLLDGRCTVITASVEEWKLDRIPGILATTRRPTVKGCLINGDVNADLISAHEAATFQAALLMKESKSVSKQVTHSGDTSAAIFEQQNDTESDLLMPEGVQTTSVDRGVDLEQFRANEDHISDRVGANHGVPPSVRNLRDATSGAEVHLRTLPLRQLRQKAIPVMRRIERALMIRQSMVNAVDKPEFAFNPEGWKMDFGEVQQPMTAMERLGVYEKERQLLLKSCIEEEMERNPDLKTPEEAWDVIMKRLDVETMRLFEMRKMQALDGGVRTGPESLTPAQNGAQGQAEQPDGEPEKP